MIMAHVRRDNRRLNQRVRLNPYSLNVDNRRRSAVSSRNQSRERVDDFFYERQRRSPVFTRVLHKQHVSPVRERSQRTSVSYYTRERSPIKHHEFEFIEKSPRRYRKSPVVERNFRGLESQHNYYYNPEKTQSSLPHRSYSKLQSSQPQVKYSRSEYLEVSPRHSRTEYVPVSPSHSRYFKADYPEVSQPQRKYREVSPPQPKYREISPPQPKYFKKIDENLIIRPTFQGPDDSMLIDSRELKKITVNIKRKLPSKTALSQQQQPLHGNPCDLVIVRRKGEGSKPIFDRPEIQKPPSRSTDTQTSEPRMVAIIREPTNTSKDTYSHESRGMDRRGIYSNSQSEYARIVEPVHDSKHYDPPPPPRISTSELKQYYHSSRKPDIKYREPVDQYSYREREDLKYKHESSNRSSVWGRLGPPEPKYENEEDPRELQKHRKIVTDPRDEEQWRERRSRVNEESRLYETPVEYRMSDRRNDYVHVDYNRMESEAVEYRHEDRPRKTVVVSPIEESRESTRYWHSQSKRHY